MRAALGEAGIPGRILYVDDGSTDGTALALAELQAEVITLDLNRGYGAAIKTGILHAETEYLAIIDADGTYLAEDIPRLFGEMRTCDMVVGRRPREKGLRRLAKGFLQSIASYAVDYPIPDINSGLRIFTRKLARDLFRLLPNGFSLTSTITLGALYTPYRVRYVPIEYRERTGKSKIKKVRALFNFTMLILRTMVLFNPLKFFLPASALLGILGTGFLIRDLRAGDLAQGSILLMVNALILFAIGLLAEAIRCRE
jgi:glycosyltransferase involved in cell wall biosynthesis